MSISQRGSNTPLNDEPLGGSTSVGDLFNRFEAGIGAPSEDAGNPGPEIGLSAQADDAGSPEAAIGAPSDDAGSPGIEIGISAPTIDDVAPAGDAPAGDSMSSGDAGDSLAGLGSWESIDHMTIVEGCGCAACQAMRDGKGDGDKVASQNAGGSPNSANPDGDNIGELLTLGTNPDGSRFFSGDRNVDAILIGSKWGTLDLTFSFPTSGSNYNGATFDPNGVSNYHNVLGTVAQDAARAAFAMIQAATGITFTEIADSDTVHANLRISQTADADVPSAYGNFPSDTRAVAGDIWFGKNNQPYYDLAIKGTWGFSTMMHEIGHAMGLKHGHQDYTNLDLSFYFGTSPRFGSQSLTPDKDGQAWSLMTYTPAPFTNSNFAGDKISQPQSYMQYDLAALQYMYGANFNTNNTDTVYTFSQTTGEMFVNGVGQGAPSDNRILLTIWDGGGNDTIDASNYDNGVTIDLRPGEFSTFDPAQLANHLAAQGLTALAPGNIAMSLLYNNDTRSLIENATGGDGNDILVGNMANNVLDGGAGSDVAVFTSTTGVNVTLNDTNADVIVNHDGETDTLRSIENIIGTSGADSIIGNSLDNLLAGGSGGADALTGNDGNDRLVGGGFTVTTSYDVGSPPSQPDIVKPQATNNNSIANAVNTAGAYDIDANPNIADATTIPHATINATATGGSLEYYRIDVTAAGARAIFDIDGTGSLTDSIIELVDGAGNLLARNDTGPGDPGTTINDDSYITYTFAAPGTYYIRVGRWISGQTPAQNMLAGQTYTLHISLEGAAGATNFTLNNTSSLVADGGEGNDYLQGTAGDDTLTGGNGNDTASFVTAYNGGGAGTTGVTVDLNLQGSVQNTEGAGLDTLTGIENLVGSQYNDTLTGDGGDNVIEGGLGADILVGGGGNDTASYAGAAGGVTVSLGLQGSAQSTVNAGTDTLSGFANLAGSGFNDSLTGDANANTLSGGAGNDTLNPGANPGGTADLLDGGLGTDTASFAGNASGVTATLNGVTDGTATIAGLAIATLRSIENLTGSSNADILTGDSNANAIEGGLGNDTLDGGLGVDTLVFTGATAVTVNLATLTAQNTGWGSDTITGFENVRTGSGVDNITGDGSDNIFFEGGGNDTYNGAGGIDTVDYSAVSGGVGVNLATLTPQNTTNAGTDTITNIENVVGSATGGNVLQGNSAGNRLTGGAAADTILGNLGIDFLVGGGGNDILIGGQNGALDDGTADTLEGGAGNDFLGGGQGNDIVRGGDGDDVLVGGIVNNSQQFFTNDGGNDSYEGGDGSDRAIVVFGDRLGVGASTVGVAFDIGNIAGNSAITFNGVNVGSMTSIEFVTFRGSAVNDVVKGGGSLDSFTGLSGDDTLDGWLGNDLLSGGLGNDNLIGGEGLDTATYANSTAGVTVDLRIQGVAQNTGGEGIDTLSGIEYLAGSNLGDTLHGNDEFNLVTDTAATGPAGQTDSIFGHGGNDTIHVTRAAAALATNINMDGGDGDDFIELRGGTLSTALTTNAAGLVAASNGASLTYMQLGTTSDNRNVDVVTVDGGAGNDRIVLSGVASATINAGSGADIVSISMRGATSVNNYQLTLGSGADIVQLGGTSAEVAATARTNRITDFEVGNSGDKLEMTSYLNGGLTGYTANSNAFASGHLRLVQSGTDLLLQIDRDAGGATNGFLTIFAFSNGYTGGFTAFNFDGFIGNLTLTGIGALDETLTGATGNDILSGMDGNDVLKGLDGNDTLYGGAGNDNLQGGNGTDTATYDGVRSDYTVTANITDGVVTGYTVTDNNPLAAAPDEGTDTLTGVESLQFSDMSMSLAGPVLLYDTTNTLVGAFATIQAAIDAASNGYRVFVSAGTYAENPNVNKDITIEGPNAGIAGDGARGAEAIVNGLFSIVADGVTIDGLTVTGAPLFGQDITGFFVNNDNATLTNLILDGPGNGYGIQTTYNGGVTGLILSNSLVTDWGAGTYFNPTTGFTATGNSFTGNGNHLLGDGWAAGSFIDNNSFHDSVGSHIGYGTYLSVEDMRDFIGTNNVFTGTGSRAVGIFAYGDGTPGGQDVTGTEYSDGFFGSEFVANSGDDSTFHGLGGDDSMTGGSGNDTFDGGSGIDTSSYSGVATIAETVTGWTVTTATEGTDTLENVEIVNDSNGGVIRLVGHGGYATIQEAIDASNDGDTIIVASGTWTENLLVDKDVTIQGVNNHGIDGTAARGAETVIDGQIIITGAGATLDGLKLVGDAPGTFGNTAVEVQASNVSLVNNIMDGDGDVAILVFAGVSGLDVGHNRIRGYSIGAYVSGGTTSGSIHDNRFQGDGGPLTGMGNGVNSETSNVTIADNVFDGIYYGSLNLFPFGPDSVDLNDYVTGNTITNSGAERPVQIMPTNATHDIVGTDFNEAFDGETAAGSYGVTGAFSFDGRGGNDHAWGGEEDDVLTGGSGDDELYGKGGSDVLDGGSGVDLIEGADGDDLIDGGGDDDSLSGGDGDDLIEGGSGSDAIDGGDGFDLLSGGDGDDAIDGGNDDDELTGGAGDDDLIGGDGEDSATYEGPRGDYTVTAITGPDGRVIGFSSVEDNVPAGGDEGSDTLTGVENLVFGDGTILDLDAAVQLFDDGGQLVGTFDTIQEAIDAASDDYVIRVAAGTYIEDLTIDVGVTILGAQAGVAVSGRDAADGAGETTIVGNAHVTAADNVTLDGLRFLNDAGTTGGGPANPTLMFQTGGGSEGHLVTDSIFWSTVAGAAADDRAISASPIAAGTITITDNLISGAAHGLFGTASWGRGIWFDGGGAALVVTGNVIEWARTGVNLDLSGDSTADISDNVLRNLGSGLSVGVDSDGLTVSGNDVSNVGTEFNFRNLTTDVAFDAGEAIDTLTPVGNGNDVVVVLGGSGNDALTGTDGDDYIDGNNNPADPNAADSDVLDGGAGDDMLFGRGGDDALDGGADDDTVSGGAGADIIDGGTGDDALSGDAGSDVMDGGAGEDMMSGGDDDDDLSGGDDNDSLSGDAGDDTLTGGSGDDTLNGGSGTDTAVVGTGATFAFNGTSWTVTSSDGTDTLTGVEIVESAGGNTLLVGSGGFTTIQAAIDAAEDGDTILIADGTYTEQLHVDGKSNLTITAFNMGAVTVASPAALALNGYSEHFGEYVRAVIAVNDSTGISITGINVDGNYSGDTTPGSNGDEITGIGYFRSSGSVDHVEIFEISNSPGGGLFGLQHGSGMFIDGEGAAGGAPAVSVTDSMIRDFQKTGVLIFGVEIDFRNNAIVGIGATALTAQNGIQIGNAEGVIDSNAISGLGYSGGGVYSSGIIAYEPSGPLAITDNDITGEGPAGSGAGIDLSDVLGVAVVITGNSFADLDYGLYAYTYTGGSVGLDTPPVLADNAFDNIGIENLHIAPEESYGDPFTTTTPFNLTGTEGDDYLGGSLADDTIDGLGGDDTLVGNGGSDTLDGGADDDSLEGGAGDDSLEGGSGIDTAVYSGAATIVENGSGGWTVTDSGGTDSLSNIEIVDDAASGRTLLVGNGGYATIQDAIDAAANGDTILVRSGIWTENLNVNKDVTIQGANHGISGTGVRGVETVIDGQLVINAAGATIDGVKLIGAAAGSLGTTAVEVKGNSFSLVNSVLDGTGDTAIITGSVTGVDIGNNLIKGYSIGVYVSGGGTTGSIHNNRFQGDPGPAQTGLGNGVNSESSHVAIANNAFDDIYFGSLNLFPFGPDSVDLNSYITGNTITNSGVPRPVQIMPTNLTHNFIGTDFSESFDGETAANVYGVTGAFSFDGRGGDDHAWGGEQGDTLSGGAGNDQLFGNGGGDTLSGGDNNDIATGGAGNDILAGGNGIDTLNGGDDDDSLDGGSGNDTLNGESGNDTMHGGAGNDSLNGGAGTDTAVYDNHRGDYSIGVITGAGGRVVGFSSVSDNEPSNGNEGADALNSVERLVFSNRTFDATQPVQLFDQTNQLVGTFNTIQAAIDSAQDNYTIRVAAGTYDEDLVINVGVRIIGARTGDVSNPLSRDPANGVGETTIIGHAKVTAEDNVTLTGLRFLNDGTTTGGGASNPTLQFLTGGGTTGHLVSSSIFWSTVMGGASGVDDRAISSVGIADGQLTFTGNLISGSQQGQFGTASWGRGIWFDGGGTTLTVSGNIIEWTRSGLTLDGAGGSISIVDNNILRNLGTAFSIATTEDGLAAAGNDFQNVGTEFNFRNITESVVFNAGSAFDTLTPVGDANDLIVILGGSGDDVLTGSAQDDVIDGNNSPTNPAAADSDILSGGSGNDLLFGRGGDDSLRGGFGDDTIDGGAGFDTATAGAGAVFVANGTSWTVTSSQGVDTLVNVERVDVGPGPGPDVLLVGSGGFATIQAAVDAANDGDTILVAAGTYVEQVVVNDRDNLTIRAADGAQVIIQAPADLVETARSSSDREIHAVFTVVNSQNVVLDNIDIDGNGVGHTVDEGGGAGQANFYGTFYRNSSGSLLNVDVTGVRDPYPGGTAPGGEPIVSGVQRGVGVVVDNDFLQSFTMTGGSISDFQKNATVFNRAILNVTGVTITGGGAQGVNAQNGIQVSNSTGTISGNTISGIGYAGPADAYSGAVLAFGNTDLNIQNNVITGSNDDSLAAKVVGIYLFGTNSGGSISGNTISHVDTGIGVYDDVTPNGILIENNSVTDVDTTDPFAAGVDFQPNPALATPHDVDGSAADDILSGGAGNDILSGLGGDDTLTGHGGDDNLDGGADEDTAIYAGPRSGYDIVAVTDSSGLVIGFSSVTDTDAGNGDEGADTLTSVERLQFGDGTLDLGQPVQLFDENDVLIATFGTIQAAIDAASDDYTIRIAAGTYDEDLIIDVGVAILGAQVDVAVGGRDAAGGAGETTIIGHAHVTAADNVILNGLRFLNDATTTGGGPSNPALQFQTGGGGVGHLVTNSIFWSTLAGGANGVDDRAISAQVIADGLLTISDNLISGTSHGQFGTASWGRGIWFDGGGVDLVVTGNTIEWTRSGLNLDMSGDSTANVSNNTLNNLGTFIAVGIDTDGLTVSNNDVTNVGDDFNFRNLGTDVTFDAEAAIDTLTPVGNGNDYVVILGGSGSDNLTGTSGADYIDANNRPGHLNVADSDTLNGAAGDDLLFGRAGDDTLNGGADNDSLDGGDGDDTLNGGSGNDSITGGSGTDTAVVGAGATYTPNGAGWTVTSSDGTDTLTGVEIVESGGGGNTLLVGSGGFATIQAAVDAANDGDTILVAAGTYVEQVVVDGFDNLTIMAAEGAQVTIQAPADLHETARSIAGREINAVFTVKDSTGVFLEGIDIDGAGAGNTVDENDGAGQANFYGVFYRNSSGGLTDVDVSHIRDALIGGELSGVQRGVGVGTDNATPLSFTMTGGSISDFQKNATVFNGADLNVTGVTITGDGATATIAQNGIQVLNSTGTISGNTITGIGYSGPGGAYSGAILAFGNTDLDIIGNAIIGANIESTGARVVGIFVVEFGTPNSGGEISGNAISFVDEGIDVSGDVTPNGILIENNTVTNIDGTDNDPVGVYFEPDPAFATAYDVDGTSGDDVLSGGAGDDSLSGLDGDDSITGNGGGDSLDGNGGEDTLTGGAGDDALDGGADIDTAAYAGSASDYTVTYATDSSGQVIGFSAVVDNVPAGGDEGSDTLTSIERLSFGGTVLDLADPVQLFDAGNNLVGTFATIQAAIDAASDDYTIRVAPGTYDEDLVIDVGVTILGAEHGVAVGGRDASGGTGETTIVGHAVVTATDNVTLDGLRFLNDTTTTAPTLQFQTGGGATGHLVTDSIFWSTIAGGAGGVDDRAISTVVIADGLITVTDNLISGTSQGQFGTASWGRGIWFDGGGVDLVFTGNTIEWTRTGLNLDMSGDSTATVSNNSFRGLGTGISVGVDADGLTVLGNDIERVNEEFNFRNLTTGFSFNAGTAVDTLTPVGDFNDPIVVLGGSGGDSVTGTAGVDVLDGNNSPTDPAAADADSLSGMGGNDFLFGRGGDDTLDGGTGDDSMTGGTGNDVYVVDSAGDSVTEAASEGTDEVRTTLAAYTLSVDLENLTGLGAIDQTLTGNGAANVIDGGAGADTMTGGLGNDTYVVDNVGDSVIENSGEGTDTIRTNLAVYSLAGLPNVENLTGTSAAGQVLTGNSVNNVIIGASGDDTLNGGDGNDQLRAGAGNDHLDGGGNNDVLYFGANFSAGDVADGGDGRDAIVLQGNVTVVFTDSNFTRIESVSLQSGANTTFGDTANNFYDFDVTTSDGNVLAGEQLIVNAQSLRAGEDFTFDGSAETDGRFLVYGGHGVDNLTGGAGVDVFFFEGQRWGDDDKVDGGAGRDALVISAGSGVTHIEFAADALTNIESISVNNFFATDPSQKPSYELVLHNGNVAPGGTLIVNGSSISGTDQFVDIDGSGVQDGNLILFSGAGDDTLIGGDGGDILFAAGGADALTGGAGADVFRYDSTADSTASSTDEIGDFETGIDKIDLSRIDADANAAGNQAFTWIGSDAFSNVAGELRAFQSGGDWIVEGDVNGDGVADLVITVTTATPLSGADFIP